MMIDDDDRHPREERLIRLVERPEAAHLRHIGRDDQVHIIERQRQPGIAAPSSRTPGMKSSIGGSLPSGMHVVTRAAGFATRTISAIASDEEMPSPSVLTWVGMSTCVAPRHRLPRAVEIGRGPRRTRTRTETAD